MLLQLSGAGEAAAGEATPSGDPAETHESDAPAIDVLFDGHEIHVLESKRVHTHNTHGTGELYLLCLLCWQGAIQTIEPVHKTAVCAHNRMNCELATGVAATAAARSHS